MRERTLFKIALITSLIGIFILYFISINVEIDETRIDKINKDDFGEIVKIKGQIEEIAETENTVFLRISQPSYIDVIVFKEKNLSLNTGNNIEIIGKIDEYNGKKEIIAERIRII